MISLSFVRATLSYYAVLFVVAAVFRRCRQPRHAYQRRFLTLRPAATPALRRTALERAMNDVAIRQRHVAARFAQR